MKYGHVLLAFASELWAMQPEKLAAIVEFLASQADGQKLSADELSARISNSRASDVARQEGAVAILPLRGIIANRVNLANNISEPGGTSAEAFARVFQAAVDDSGVKAIVFDVDSPGGAVQGTEELAAQIFAARGSKPIIAQVNANAASAAYWIASAADEIVLTPSGAVGSIGVFTVHDDVSAALDKMGVKKTLIGAGKYKAETMPFNPLADDARAHLQDRVNVAYDSFVRRVATNRNASQSAVRDGFGQGRMVDGQAAVAAGMADRLGTMSDTLARFGVATSAPAKRRAFAPEREKRALAL